MPGWLQILTLQVGSHSKIEQSVWTCVYLPGESMTGCLDELMDKANEMGLDECWDDVSDEDKADLEPMFRLHTILFQCMEEVVSTILRSSLKKVRCCEIVE